MLGIWDIHRTQAALVTLFAPEVSRDIVLSLLAMAKAGGDIPRWPLLNGYTGCMIGSHANIMILDALVKGAITREEASLFYPFMRATAMGPRPNAGRGCIEAYIQYGFCPKDASSGSVSKTLAYAFDDWALSEIAKICKKPEEDVTLFKNRSENYRNVFEPKKKFFCPRESNGAFHCPLIPELSFTKDYVEGNPWHYRFFVPHNVPGLMELFGGKDAFKQSLEEFLLRSEIDESDFLPNPYYWAGNEEDLLSPFEFHYAGRPDLSSKYARRQVESRYSTTPSGIPGNDDYGTMSSWLFWSSLGLYPEMGTGRFFVVAPLFEEITIDMGVNDRDKAARLKLSAVRRLTIHRHGTGTTIQSVTVNGRSLSLSNLFVSWEDLVGIDHCVIEVVVQ